jgi:hypothetical protein
MSSGCRKCGKPVYIKPDGNAAFLCSECIMAAFENLGIFPKEQAVEHRVQRTAEPLCQVCLMPLSEHVRECVVPSTRRR